MITKGYNSRICMIVFGRFSEKFELPGCVNKLINLNIAQGLSRQIHFDFLIVNLFSNIYKNATRLPLPSVMNLG